MNKSLALSFVLVTLVFVSGCVDHDLSQVPPNGEYFPTNQDARFFLREQFTHPNLSERFYYDTIKIGFVRDTLIGNKVYHQFDYFSKWQSGNGIIEVHDYHQFLRREGSRYLEPPLYQGAHETVVLDLEKPAGSSWIYYSGFEDEIKTTYKVNAVYSMKEINGIVHNNVIEVEMEVVALNKQTGAYDFLVNRTTRCYAKDKGEVYSLSQWYGYTGALRLSQVEGD